MAETLSSRSESHYPERVGDVARLIRARDIEKLVPEKLVPELLTKDTEITDPTILSRL